MEMEDLNLRLHPQEDPEADIFLVMNLLALRGAVGVVVIAQGRRPPLIRMADLRLEPPADTTTTVINLPHMQGRLLARAVEAEGEQLQGCMHIFVDLLAATEVYICDFIGKEAKWTTVF